MYLISSTDIAAQQDQQATACDKMVLSQTASVNGNDIST